MNRLLLFFGFFTAVPTFAFPLLFPKDDPYKQDKLAAIELIEEVLGPINAASQVLSREKIVFWANEARVIPRRTDEGTIYLETRLPSFSARTEGNANSLRAEIERLCECSTGDQEIAGILIANPFEAATMFSRRGWNGRTGEEVEGSVPPLVIIYHEFAHIRDYLANPQFFFDMAANFNRRYKNEAERSAVQEQNVLALALSARGEGNVPRRQSYGQNELYAVDGLLDF